MVKASAIVNINKPDRECTHGMSLNRQQHWHIL